MRTNAANDARMCVGHSSVRRLALCFISLFAFSLSSSAQLSFSTAIRLAVQNSPRVRAAQLELKKAKENVAAARDMFIPSVVTGGGLGWTYGITLTVPTIFTIGAQSLVYSNQQRYAIRAAHADLEAAQFALIEARQQTEEDTAVTYLALIENQSVLAALAQQRDLVTRLVQILEDRVNAGVDSELDLKKVRRGQLQLELQLMQTEDDRASLLSNLAGTTGLPVDQVNPLSDTVPLIPDAHWTMSDSVTSLFIPPGILSAEATQRAKLDRARGDQGYTWKPIITFGAQYGRVSPINNVTSFYNLNGNYNTANVGVQLSLPMFDKVRRDAARASLADVARSAMDLASQQEQEAANRTRLQRSMRQMSTKVQIAELDYEIAQDELTSTTIQVHGSGGAAPLTPKEEQNAKIQERQKYLGLLDAQFQLHKAQISLLRQTGQLDGWLKSLLLTP